MTAEWNAYCAEHPELLALQDYYVDVRITGNPERAPYTSSIYCPLCESPYAAIEDAKRRLPTQVFWDLKPGDYKVLGVRDFVTGKAVQYG